MQPLLFNLGPTELLIILAIVLLLFGGSRLAGLGKSTGRALKEFKEETRDLKANGQAPPAALQHDPTVASPQVPPAQPYVAPVDPTYQQPQPYAGQPHSEPGEPYQPPSSGAHSVDDDRR